MGSGTVYAAGADGNLYALDATTGHLRWSYTTGSTGFDIPVVDSGTVYVGSADGNVYALNAGS